MAVMPRPFSENLFGQRRDDAGNWAGAVDLAVLAERVTDTETDVTALTATVDALGIRAPGASAPASPIEGDLWYETDTDTLWAYSGTAWQEVWAPDHAVSVRSSVGTNVPNGTITKITFDAVVWDRNGNWRDSTDDYLVARAGLYDVEGWYYTSGGGSAVQPRIHVNGALRAMGTFFRLGGAMEQAVGVHDHLELNVNDVVDFRVENSSGAGTATGGALGGHAMPRLIIKRIGPLIP